MDGKLPGMTVAPVAACLVLGGKAAAVDDTRAKTITGVHQVVRLDDAVAVVAAHMWAAKQRPAALDVRWDEGPHAQVSTAHIVAPPPAAPDKPRVVPRNDAHAPKAMPP